MKRLNDWLPGRPPQPDAGSGFKFRKGKEEPPSIICVGCEQRVPLWDEMEQCFASPEIQQRVRELQEELGQIRNPKLEARSHEHLRQGFGIRFSGFLRASTFGFRHSTAAFPALLVIRNAEGEVRWMEVRDWLKRASDNGRSEVNQVVFEGERFDVMSVRRWRARVFR